MSIAQQPDAAISYRRHRKAVDGLLASIADGLAEYDAKQAKRPTDWGYVGTLAAWRESLQEIHDALWHLGEYAHEPVDAEPGRVLEGR